MSPEIFSSPTISLWWEETDCLVGAMDKRWNHPTTWSMISSKWRVYLASKELSISHEEGTRSKSGILVKEYLRLNRIQGRSLSKMKMTMQTTCLSQSTMIEVKGRWWWFLSSRQRRPIERCKRQSLFLIEQVQNLFNSETSIIRWFRSKPIPHHY